MQESLSKLPPDAKENLTDRPAVEICTRDTASSNIPLKKNPVERIGQEHWSKPLLNEPDDGAVVNNEELARQKLSVSSRIGSKHHLLGQHQGVADHHGKQCAIMVMTRGRWWRRRATSWW